MSINEVLKKLKILKHRGVYNLFSYKKNGFTLAEVLITIGIIGIVAAMTLPSIIENHQKQETVSRLRKAYATLSQVIARSAVDNGDVSQWEGASWGEDLTSSETTKKLETFVKTYIIPYMIVTKDCGLGNIKGCRNEKFCIKSKQQCWNSTPSYAYYFITPDARYVISYDNSGGVTVNNRFGVSIDVNGNSGPNVYGRDVFFGFINLKKSRFEFVGYDAKREDLINDKTSWGCNEISTTKTSCAAIIQLDGWKIKDDYPW